MRRLSTRLSWSLANVRILHEEHAPSSGNSCGDEPSRQPVKR